MLLKPPAEALLCLARGFLLGRDLRKPMNYVTFAKKETRSGEFVVFLHNYSQKLVSEKFRSKDLDEVVNKLKGGSTLI
jgi:hypothetical protein